IDALYKRTGYMRDDIIEKLDALQKLKLIKYNKIKKGKIIKILKNKFTKADKLNYINKIKLKMEFDQAKFREVVKFCSISSDCRRKFLLNYFGEEYNEPNCGKCDVCRGTYISNVENFSIQPIHKKILYCVFLRDGEVGKQKIAKIMKGSYDLEPRYRDWDEFGMLKEADIKTIANEINLLIKTKYLLLKQGKYPVVTLSIKGLNVLKRESFKI
ncbi:MAG TPA: RecQ family zinc-binding domain-containing protein, partial [Spirochaetota bacterium]|nr:RecQ family zinc-binding domain-containing protein [Spirochaetota bacterium]